MVSVRAIARGSNRPPGAAKRAVDVATVFGLISGIALLMVAIAIGGGSARSFVDVPSVLIVIGGTVSVVTMCFSLGEMTNTVHAVSQTLFHGGCNPTEAAMRTLRLAELARRRGILHLQAVAGELAREPFLHKGMTMAVDGIPSEQIEEIMRRDLEATIQRHARSADVLRKAAEYAPAMGLIGTLIGLVQMLGNLDDPSSIGPSMAVALLTTFYGAVLANMVFSPLAAKLERNSSDEALVNLVYVMGAVSVSRQENPRRLEMMINSVLPPSGRVKYFD